MSYVRFYKDKFFLLFLQYFYYINYAALNVAHRTKPTSLTFPAQFTRYQASNEYVVSERKYKD